MKYKLVCFDLDGTIIDETVFIWQTIHEKLETDGGRRKKLREQFYSKEISYEEWAKYDIELWKEKNARKNDILNALKDIRLMKGAGETLAELKKKGYKLVVISGSLNIAIEKVLPDYREIFDYIFINEVFFDKEGNLKEVKATKYDFEHKATGLIEIAKKENISMKECVFVGDQFNDVHAAEKAGLAIAFNSDNEELKKVCDVVIDKKDLREILRFL